MALAEVMAEAEAAQQMAAEEAVAALQTNIGVPDKRPLASIAPCRFSKPSYRALFVRFARIGSLPAGHTDTAYC